MPQDTFEYDRSLAVAYAHRWAHQRNPVYYSYDGIGGDCTNFVSQCLFAGAREMNYSPAYGWYYLSANNKSPSWTGVPFLRNFLIGNKSGPGPFAVEATAAEMMPGDVVQLSFEGKSFQHSALVVAAGSLPAAENILVATHSDDQDYYALTGYAYQSIRFIHILSVRK
jgi:hypothetical protein